MPDTADHGSVAVHERRGAQYPRGGVEDYGIYNVLGVIVPMFAFLNGPMVASTQRYLTFESVKEFAPSTHRATSRLHKD